MVCYGQLTEEGREQVLKSKRKKIEENEKRDIMLENEKYVSAWGERLMDTRSEACGLPYYS